MHFRIGIGTDLHRLEEGIPLKIGGVEIPWHKGPAGHSDGDTLLHAICDALLGAAALGDIGSHFSDKDPKYKNIDSRELLKMVDGLLKQELFEIANIDSVVHLQEPKLRPYIGAIEEEIAKVLNLDPNLVSVKAKTGEKTGPVGEGRVVEAMAVVLIHKTV